MASSSDQIVALLRERIVDQIRTGALEYGDRLSSARELAVELDVDPRTVLAAYHVLAEEELVELRRRSGVYVAARHGPARSMTAPPVRWMVDVIAEGISRDIAAPLLADRFREATGNTRMRAAVVECNHDQIHSLSRELREDYGLEVSGLDLDTIDLDGPAPREIEQADVIVSAAHREVIRGLAARVRKPYVVVSVRSDLIQRTSRLLVRGPVYLVVSDARFAEKMRRLFAPVPGGDNLRIIVVGRDDLSAIPPDATTYVMRRAREMLGDVPVPGRAVPAMRIFSPDSARAILTIMVRRNLEGTGYPSR